MSVKPNSEGAFTPLLSAADPSPVEVVNANAKSVYVLTCEHAGRAIPHALGDLSLSEHHLQRHIAWDIGARGLALLLAKALQAPLVLQHYSRLVVDCNRPHGAKDLIPEVSDGTEIPGNVALTQQEIETRVSDIHTPFHAQVASLLDARARTGTATALVSVHSFTQRLDTETENRPWDLGLLHHRHEKLSHLVHDELKTQASHLTVAFNEPYSITDTGDYTIPVHGERRDIPNILLEVRNDHIAYQTGQEVWSKLLSDVLNGAAEGL